MNPYEESEESNVDDGGDDGNLCRDESYRVPRGFLRHWRSCVGVSLWDALVSRVAYLGREQDCFN